MQGNNLRASWIATAIAGLLAVSTPLAARVAGEVSGTSVRSVRASGAHPHGSLSDARGLAKDASRILPRLPVRDGTPPDRSPEHHHPSFRPHVLVHLERALTARARPEADARAVGTVVASSKYYHVPLVAWVEELSENGRWGLVELPYVSPRRDGWIPVARLQTETSAVTVRVDLSRHHINVWKRGELLFGAPTATGAPSSPTPPGAYFVTDRVPFPAGSALGTFAFGISGIQPRLPAGWSGGDQLAIHGTDSPWSIGQSVSAGCMRVGASTLARLLPLLKLGTPVVVVP